MYDLSMIDQAINQKMWKSGTHQNTSFYVGNSNHLYLYHCIHKCVVGVSVGTTLQQSLLLCLDPTVALQILLFGVKACFSAVRYHLLECALYTYSYTWKLVVPTTVSCPVDTGAKTCRQKGLFFIILKILFLYVTITKIFRVFKVAVVNCFKTISAVGALSFLLFRRVACVLLSERQHDAYSSFRWKRQSYVPEQHSGRGIFPQAGIPVAS